MRFSKMQGLGNDYVYVSLFSERIGDASALARRLSDRHFGVGADGLVLIGPSEKADFRMQMFNSDGSRGAMCGNASRCVAKYVYERGLTDRTALTLETDAGLRALRLTLKNGKVSRVAVDMGAPDFACARVPCTLAGGEAVNAPVELLDRTFRATAVSMGNPHAVIFLGEDEDVGVFPLEKYGPAAERHPAFPDRVNAEFVNALPGGALRARVWERGSGETLACGTGACAIFAAARRLGLCGERARIELPGGALEIERLDSGSLLMTGPAEFVFDGEIELEESEARL